MTIGKRFSFVLNSANGRPVANATVDVKNYGTTVVSTIYADAAKVAEADNPLLTDSDGYYEYFADPGRYTEVITTNDDIATLSDIAIVNPP